MPASPDTLPLAAPDAAFAALPPAFAGWFRHKGWAPHPHQLAMLAAAREGASALLIAPTGGGKTLAGFLPSLIDLAERPRPGLHTLYISPLKALAHDIRRNLERPVAEIRLPIRTEARTGDTPQKERERQAKSPPHILTTTPESLALLLTRADAGAIFGGLAAVVVDELHALAGSKRGDLLALNLARLARLAPRARRIGLSATVADPQPLLAWLSRTGRSPAPDVRLIVGRGGARADIRVLETVAARIPWSGHMALHAMPEVYEAIRAHRTTIVFVNTRAQAELCFQALWRLNEEALPIALHHGSLAREQRQKVETAMAAGALRAVVATASLDLGLDWAEVDLVVQVGAPKGVSRLLQRIGRAGHRLDTPSKALLVPASRFELLECQAALEAIDRNRLDGEAPPPGGLDVLAQHIAATAVAGPFAADDLYEEVTATQPYAALDRARFDRVLDFVATGGYALRAYERFRKLVEIAPGRWAAADASLARLHRLNVGTIVEAPVLKVRLRGGGAIGEVEEYFAAQLVPGDTFMFAGELLEFVEIREMTVIVRRGGTGEPKVPIFAGARMPLSTFLSDQVRDILEQPARWRGLPEPVRDWLALQRRHSRLPPRDGLLVELFPRGGKHFLVAYGFEGRNAHQTLGMLLTRRMERAGLRPLGFVATDYVVAIWSLNPAGDVAALFDPDMLGDDLEAWMDECSLLRRTFRSVAVIAGLIERRHPGLEKSGRQVTFSADLIYDVLRRHDPDHVLLHATRQDAARGLTDIARLSGLLERAAHGLAVQRLDRVSPLAVPILIDYGRESVPGGASDALLLELEAELLREAAPELLDDGPAAAAQRALPL